MSGLMIFIIVFLVVILFFILFIASMYNKLIQLKNRFKNSFAQIDVQLRRRYDLIPNLVETAKGYMKHEQETLEKVINARNQANQINIDLGKEPADPALMEKLVAAESSLSSCMKSFFALSESYPDLKADSTMNNLMEELTTTENKVSFARQAYNDSVMEYNTEREQFPSNFIAGMFNFSGAFMWEIKEESARGPVKVSF